MNIHQKMATFFEKTMKPYFKAIILLFYKAVIYRCKNNEVSSFLWIR